MTQQRAAFRHPKRPCRWCRGNFTPSETISPVSTETLCSPECAVEHRHARQYEQGVFVQLQESAIAHRAAQSVEIAERLRLGRERARQEREESSGG